jgi:maltose alpha-D-glucosyltransferase/alpha-amylase
VTDKATSDLWWKNAIVYCLDVKTWLDGDGDGIGDFAGLTRRLDYLDDLGVNCIWLTPFYPSPDLDDGYDVTDYFAVDERYGTLGDFVEFVRTARSLGISVVIDLVLNHTSDQHPWFQKARRDRGSRYRDYYIWSDEPKQEPAQIVFPGEQDGTWTYDGVAGQWYMHRYHEFVPDLNIANPAVRDEMNKIMGFWLELGVAGFRVDSAPFLLETTGLTDADGSPDDYLRELRQFLTRRSGNAVFLGEANVEPAEQVRYFGDEHGDGGMHMLFDFSTSAATWLALARGDAEPLRDYLAKRPVPPEVCQYAVFLRHHDELSLESLTEGERDEGMALLAPEESWRIYGRGIRRRLAPLLGGDQRRIRLAFSLLLSLPGTPVILYGDEIGMGDDLGLPGRRSVRIPMQWTKHPGCGFSSAPAERLVRPVQVDGPYGYQAVNVVAQQRDPDSLLSWTGRAIRARRQCPELAWSRWEPLDAGDRRVLAHRARWRSGEVVVLHNLSPEPVSVRLDGHLDGQLADEVFGDGEYGGEQRTGDPLELRGHGYRWLRVRQDGTGQTSPA